MEAFASIPVKAGKILHEGALTTQLSYGLDGYEIGDIIMDPNSTFGVIINTYTNALFEKKWLVCIAGIVSVKTNADNIKAGDKLYADTTIHCVTKEPSNFGCGLALTDAKNKIVAMYIRYDVKEGA